MPALVRSARLLGHEGQFQEALEQVDFALEYEPRYAEAKLLRGPTVDCQKDLDGRAWRNWSDTCRERPEDADAKKLLELCATGKAR